MAQVEAEKSNKTLARIQHKINKIKTKAFKQEHNLNPIATKMPKIHPKINQINVPSLTLPIHKLIKIDVQNPKLISTFILISFYIYEHAFNSKESSLPPGLKHRWKYGHRAPSKGSQDHCTL